MVMQKVYIYVQNGENQWIPKGLANVIITPKTCEESQVQTTIKSAGGAGGHY